MWYLINPKGKRIFIKPNEELTFGRKKAIVLLQEDESISRLHASISIQPKITLQMDEPTSSCMLKDQGSKYGTYILKGDQKIRVSDKAYELKNNDRIRFGLQDSIYTVLYEPFITVISTLDDNDKKKLQILITEIDGMMIGNWINGCTHLTVSRATLTEKVTWAMASAMPIVTINYWEQMKCAIEANKDYPKIEDFVPLISESLVIKDRVSLCPKEERKRLFKNLIFVLLSASQYKRYGRIINAAGGKSLLYSKRPLSDNEISSVNVIVMQYPSNDATQSTQSVVPEYDSIYNVLQKNKRRMIAESEIALAILHCSIEKYCNPLYTFAAILKRSCSKVDSSEVLALDTQDVPPVKKRRQLPAIISDVRIKSSSEQTLKGIRIIPETCDSLTELPSTDFPCQMRGKSIPNKRCRDEEKIGALYTSTPKDQNSVKRFKVDARYIPETNDSSISYVSQSKTQSSTQSSDFVPSTCNIESTVGSGVSMIVNKGTLSPKTRDVSIDLTNERNEAEASVRKDERVSELDTRTEQRKSPELINESGGIPEVIMISSTPNVSNRNSSNKESNKTSSTVTLSAVERFQEIHKKRIEESDRLRYEDFLITVREKVRAEKKNVNDTEKRVEECASTSTEITEVSSNVSGPSTSFVRPTNNFKRFKKVPVMIPAKRITMNDMYVWNKFGITNS